MNPNEKQEEKDAFTQAVENALFGMISRETEGYQRLRGIILQENGKEAARRASSTNDRIRR